MGKEQDLLDAARCGNISVVERILNQYAKRTGPLASLRRGPGPNVQDHSGYTPLHHSALNGHKDIVSLLLSHEASTNVVDDKGCTPLHLAAWSGNTEIVKLVLTHGPSVPNVNHVNFDHETALHSAAQYGHTEVVKLLLQHNSNPSVRNVKNESPLDLASQYGRLETVQCLINSYPALLTDLMISHSPLHLASRNGHKNVVKMLLDSGFNVNFMTDVGTGLHEAAIYGKTEVVKMLLEYGIDVNLENSRKRTVFNILQDLNTNISKQIEDIIRGHMTLINLDTDISESSSPISPPQGFDLGPYANTLVPERCSLPDISPPRQFCSSDPDASFYEIPPPPKIINHTVSLTKESLYSLTPSHSQESSFDHISHSSSSPSNNESLQAASYDSSLSHDIEPDDLLYEIPPPPSFFSSKRFSDPLQQNSIYQNVVLTDSVKKDQPFEQYTLPASWTLPNNYIPMLPLHSMSSNKRPQAPVKPPRKSVTSSSFDTRNQVPMKAKESNYEFLCLASSGIHHSTSHFIDENDMNSEQISYSDSNCGSEYVDMKLRNSMIGTYENQTIIANGVNLENQVPKKKDENKSSHVTCSKHRFTEILPFSVLYEEMSRKIGSFNSLMPSKSTPALHAARHTLDHVIPPIGKEIHTSKPNCLDLKQKRATIQIPLSPTNYQQPPTPDIPPPSPATAETGIHEKIHPINQEYRSKKLLSRDIDTITDEHLVATIGPYGEVQLTLATENKCVSTENVETIDCNPFAGLYRGSVSCSEKYKENLQLPVTVRNSKYLSQNSKNIYENVKIMMAEDQSKVILSSSGDICKENNHSSLSVMSPFDEKAEWAEIANIMASFGGGIARESLFSQDMESHFTEVFRSDSQRTKTSFNSVEEWLLAAGLPQYENLLIINGFDDIKFLGGKILEEQDLEEIGVTNLDHRKQIFLSAQRLQGIQPVSKARGTPEFPASVDDWLSSLSLEEYSETFSNNNITNMDRALKLWEVELNTVLKITKVGHRKRILASIGDKHFERFFDGEELDLSKLNLQLSELDIYENNEPKYGIVKSAMTASDTPYVLHSSREENSLRIRPPTQLMGDSDSSQFPQQMVMEAQWRHHPDVLIRNCCDYMAKYLGSTLVKELKGLESTKRSIQKLKFSSRDIGKIPNIILSISYCGVKFIDAETQQLVCEHEIRNIHCACQDADDLRHFAYITKEHQTHNHYCHVFSAQNMDLASEIILTLGQAFEVAYQMAIKEKALKAGQRLDSNSTTMQSVPKNFEVTKLSTAQS